MAGGIEAGRLKDRVTLLRPEYTKDAYGQPVISWVTVGVFFAEVSGNGGGTSLSVGRSSITYNHTIRVRKSSALATISAAWKIRWKNRDFAISSIVDQDNDGAILEIECSDEVPESA